MHIPVGRFIPRAGKALDLDDWPTRVRPVCRSARQYRTVLKEHVAGLRARQQLQYASHRTALLLILQGMDTAGKDGTIQHIMSGVDPQGCDVHSFGPPSAEELEHDFLWRTNCRLPARGRIGIFNRSYYEEVLIVRVHPGILAGENLPHEATGRNFWQHRYRSIVDLERHLHASGTRIIKIFLHLSKAEQRQRFLERIADPHKNWKLSRSDIHERKYWKEYAGAYAEALSATNTPHAPWHIVPADDKDNARLIVSQIVMDVFDSLQMAYPVPGAKQRRELQVIARHLRKS
jgi:PPK2 family polyphosphate:nucleotide phosphotransferase